MGKITKDGKKFVELCKCGHNKISHEKPTIRDEGRSNLNTIKTRDSECGRCKEESKTCKKFEPKKKGLVDKIKKKFK